MARAWPRIAVAIGSVWIALVWLDRPVLGIDTLPLLRGTEALASCLRELDLVDCSGQGAIDAFPALQHIPDLAAYSLLGLSDGGRVRVLAFLSGLAIAGSVAAAWAVLRQAGCAEWTWMFLVAVASGPVIAYGNTTWGEMLAAGLLTLLVAAAFLPGHAALVGLAAFGAALTKETGYPFVAALGLLALVLGRRRTGRSIRPAVVAGAIGLALAIAVASALNLVRFGSVTNTHYLNDDFRTPAGRVLELADGLIVSPSGGMLLFWPIASVLVGVLIAVPITRAAGSTASMQEQWPAIALLAILAALVLGFASWWVPFGWAAWGPRLSLPWVLPLLLLSLAAFGAVLRPGAARLFAHWWTVPLFALAVVVVAAPHVGYLWRYSIVPAFFSRETAHCPAFGPGTRHYECLSEQMWSRRPIWLDAFAGLTSTAAVLTLVAVAMVATGALVLFRRELREATTPSATVSNADML